MLALTADMREKKARLFINQFKTISMASFNLSQPNSQNVKNAI